MVTCVWPSLCVCDPPIRALHDELALVMFRVGPAAALIALPPSGSRFWVGGNSAGAMGGAQRGEHYDQGLLHMSPLFALEVRFGQSIGHQPMFQ